MIILLSPAKNLDFKTETKSSKFTNPLFQKESKQLVEKLKQLNSKKLGELMNLSEKLSDLNYHRFQEWNIPNKISENARQAAFAFWGNVYQGLDFYSLSEEDIDFAQNQLRILSGLHGILKPLDLIMPYRLEMGTKLALQGNKNLYEFWGNKLTDIINQELNDGVLVNLASNEYFKAIKPKSIKGTIVNCQFKDNKNGVYKAIMTYAKMARGYMARYIIQNKITDIENLKGFDLEGYVFNNSLSKPNELVFTRG